MSLLTSQLSLSWKRDRRLPYGPVAFGFSTLWTHGLGDRRDLGNRSFIYWFPLRQAVFKCWVPLSVPVVEREARPPAWFGGPVLPPLASKRLSGDILCHWNSPNSCTPASQKQYSAGLSPAFSMRTQETDCRYSDLCQVACWLCSLGR